MSSRGGKTIKAHPARAATLSDIAAVLGLDTSSVSLALRGSHKISEDTRARVRETAIRLGYQPNIAARQLRKGRQRVIGLVLSENFATLASQAAVQTVQELARLSGEREFFFSIISGNELATMAERMDEMPFLPDGTFIWGDVPAERLGVFQEFRRPFIVIDPNHPSYKGFVGPAVRIDNHGGGRLLAARLIERGVDCALFVRVLRDHLGHEERWLGVRSGWLENKPPHKISECALDDLSDEHLRAFAAEPGGGVVCSNDQGAAVLWHRLAKLGLAVPAQVSLTGFDGDSYGAFFDLTTVLFDYRNLALAAFKSLVSSMEAQGGKKGTPTLVPVTLKAGGTT